MSVLGRHHVASHRGQSKCGALLLAEARETAKLTSLEGAAINYWWPRCRSLEAPSSRRRSAPFDDLQSLLQSGENPEVASIGETGDPQETLDPGQWSRNSEPASFLQPFKDIEQE